MEVKLEDMDEMMETLCNINGLARLLEAASSGDIEDLRSDNVSSPLLSLATIIEEKTKLCLKLMGEDPDEREKKEE